ncbi:MAG: peptide ABC transporter substrate-binding protein [Bdellovibrionota bacterium]
MRFLFLFLLCAPAFAESINIQLSGEPNTLDPFQVSDVLGFGIVSNIAEGLVRLNGKGKLENGLAASYKTSKDGLKYEFTLSDSAKWSDGEKVTADQFVLGLRHALSPKTAARDAELLFSIKGAKEYYAGKSEILGVSVSGKKLVIELEHPDSAFLQVLSMPLASPIRKEADWDYKDPVTGPYRITKYKVDRQIELEPNPFNHEADQLPIIFKVIPEETTALNLLETGRIDIISSIPNTEIKRLGSLVHLFPGAATNFMVFDISRPPFDNIVWRKAFAASLDPKSIAAVLSGPLSESHSYIPSAIEGFKNFENKDFAESREKIRATSARPEVKITYASSANANLILQKIQSDLAKNLSLHVSLDPLEWKAFLGRLKSNANQVFFMGWSAPFNDPISHLKPFLSGQVDNHSHYASPAYDALVRKIAATPEGKARTKLVQQAQEHLVSKDVIVVPLFERQQIFGIGKNIAGFEVNPFTVIQLTKLRKK